MSNEEQLGDENVHGIKQRLDTWSRFSAWDEPKPDPEPVVEQPKAEVKSNRKKVRLFDRDLATKMATWLRKRDGISFDDAMDKLKADTGLYEELQNLKRW
jgi:hypothetical protein